MEHAVPSENFQRENGTTFSEIPLFPEIFQRNEPKNHVPFTTQPEFPESLGKWKTPKEAIEARVIGVKITWVSNYRCPITKSSNRTAVIGHPRDRAPIT